MNDVLKTPDCKEDGDILNRERVASRTLPETGTTGKKVNEHVFYGMNKDMGITPQDELNKLRDSRTDDL